MSRTLVFPQVSVVHTGKHGALAGCQHMLQDGWIGSQSMLVSCVNTCMHARQRSVCGLHVSPM